MGAKKVEVVGLTESEKKLLGQIMYTAIHYSMYTLPIIILSEDMRPAPVETEEVFHLAAKIGVFDELSDFSEKEARKVIDDVPNLKTYNAETEDARRILASYLKQSLKDVSPQGESLRKAAKRFGIEI